LKNLLTEIAARIFSLFIDGNDRVEVGNRGIVSDLIGTILRSNALAQ